MFWEKREEFRSNWRSLGFLSESLPIDAAADCLHSQKIASILRSGRTFWKVVSTLVDAPDRESMEFG